MRRWVRLVALLGVAACSSLDEGEGGVVALEVELPAFQTRWLDAQEHAGINIGETIASAENPVALPPSVVDEPPLRTSEKSAFPLVPLPPLPKRLSKTPIMTSRMEWQALEITCTSRW